MELLPKSGPFDEPVLRCDRCERLIQADKIKSIGQCPHCGNRRVRALEGFSLWEYLKMRFWWKINQQFLGEFTKA